MFRMFRLTKAEKILNLSARRDGGRRQRRVEGGSGFIGERRAEEIQH
ncbi:MAG TPA: hypothetical protein VJS15_06665 [Allosphingosinicella sp.]|nr:hypothetical protein [Allosphingosinicella sp.]